MPEQVLFVDDDPSLLDGLKRMLRSKRNSWEMTFASNAAEALASMQTLCYDVVVSDMRMPDISGAQLLSEVKKICPRSVRIILSGQADLDLIVTAIGATHQYLSKPCDAEMIKMVVDRACRSRDVLPSNDLRELVSQISSLQCQASHLARLQRECSSGSPSLAVLIEILSTDIGMSAHVLQLVNSAFFGVHRSVTSVFEAVEILGIDVIRKLVLAENVFSSVSSSPALDSLVQELNVHSVETAKLCRHFAKLEKVESRCEEYYTAALLHDVGRLIFLTAYPQKYCEMMTSIEMTEAEFCIKEREIFGGAHPEVGAYLLTLWGIPVGIEEAVCTHHSHLSDIFDLVSAVQMADYITYMLAGSSQAKHFDLTHLRKHGLEGRISEWQKH